MTAASNAIPVAEQLEEIVRKGGIPAPYDRWGARLLGYLRRPVQVVVTGLPRSGKSSVIEMVSGQRIMAPHVSVPVIELCHGERERVILERADGSVSTSPGRLSGCEIPPGTLRARQELPDTRLSGCSFVEQALTGDMQAMKAMLGKAVAQANIVIWCGEDFTEAEQVLWSDMPDRIKDHSFLALTKADTLLKGDALSRRIERLGPVVADEFLGLYPVATLQAIAAQVPGGEPELWAASGGGPLMQSLQRQIRQGRSADIDSAQVFLRKLGALPGRAAVNENEPPQAMQAPAGQAEPSSAEPSTPGKPEAPEPSGDRTATDPATMSLLSDAIDLLQDQGERMLAEFDRTHALDPDAILDSCTAALATLSDLLGRGGSDDPVCKLARESVEEGDELLMLFRLERSEEAALDAVTLLLQIRKELIGQAND